MAAVSAVGGWSTRREPRARGAWGAITRWRHGGRERDPDGRRDAGDPSEHRDAAAAAVVPAAGLEPTARVVAGQDRGEHLAGPQRRPAEAPVSTYADWVWG